MFILITDLQTVFMKILIVTSQSKNNQCIPHPKCKSLIGIKGSLVSNRIIEKVGKIK